MRPHLLILLFLVMLDSKQIFSQSGIIDPEWIMTRGSAQIDESWGVDTDSDGNILYIAGETYSYGEGKNDALLMKICNLPSDVETSKVEPNQFTLSPNCHSLNNRKWLKMKSLCERIDHEPSFS